MLPKKVLFLNCGLFALYFTYKAIKYRKAMQQIEDDLKNQNKIVNKVLFFCTPEPGDCEKHMYQKVICAKPECPYRKMRAVIDCLESCRKTLDVCIYLLTSEEIARSLINAHKRGVNVRVLCDNEMSTNKGSQVKYLNEHGVKVKMPLLNYHMHSKIAIIDGWKIMTGSANWTVQGMNGNWDNLIITSHKEIVSDAITGFNLMWNNPETTFFC